MDTFSTLFGSLLALVYHGFDRIVIQGYLPLLTREEHIVHFFRDVHGIYPITKQALAARTQEYQQWVEAFARNHRIPIEWADNKALKAKGLTREDYVRPYCRRLERRRRYGPYFIFKSLDQGPKFQVVVPKGPHPGSPLPDHPADARALYPLLLLHSGRGARLLHRLRGVVPSLPDHVQPKRASLHCG